MPEYGIICAPIATLYDIPSLTCLHKEKGLCSAISDELLYGMGIAVTGESQTGFVPVRTHYGYEGFLREEDFLPRSLREIQEWEAADIRVISGICADITSEPVVQSVCLASLFRGALVRVLEFDSYRQPGWARVALADGRIGFMRNQFLMEKKYSLAGLWKKDAQDLPQAAILDEAAFRDAVAATAWTYLGVQYRWGGKTVTGIDCSGLTSMSYMLNGILIYRDARIADGFPVHEISASQMKKGDLLYFPGHIALYLGEGRYIHSTGKVGSGGVVRGSFRPEDPDYREDLAKNLYAVGSIF